MEEAQAPWCRCLMGGQGDGYRYLAEIDLWVHNRCLLPTKMVYEKQVDAGLWDIICYVD